MTTGRPEAEVAVHDRCLSPSPGAPVSIHSEVVKAMSLYMQWSRTEHGEPTRIATTLLAGPIFLGLLPIVVAGIGPRLDRRVGLPPLRIGTVGRILGGLLTAAGFTLGFWSVFAQLDRGRGTPLPVMPTQELLTDGPFRYCRNPMTLGAVLAYLGIAVAAKTTAGMAVVLALTASLLVYLKRLEEGELAERFGEAYLAYQRETPFIVPRLSHRPAVAAGIGAAGVACTGAPGLRPATVG